MSPDNYSNLFDIINRLKNKDISAQDFFLYQLPSQEYLFIAGRNWISTHGLTQMINKFIICFIFCGKEKIRFFLVKKQILRRKISKKMEWIYLKLIKKRVIKFLIL